MSPGAPGVQSQGHGTPHSWLSGFVSSNYFCFVTLKSCMVLKVGSTEQSVLAALCVATPPSSLASRVFKLRFVYPLKSPSGYVVAPMLSPGGVRALPRGNAKGAHSEAQTLSVLSVGRRKKVLGRKKTQSRPTVRSRSSGTRSKRRQGRVKKRKGKKIKVMLDSVPPGGCGILGTARPGC